MSRLDRARSLVPQKVVGAAEGLWQLVGRIHPVTGKRDAAGGSQPLAVTNIHQFGPMIAAPTGMILMLPIFRD